MEFIYLIKLVKPYIHCEIFSRLFANVLRTGLHLVILKDVLNTIAMKIQVEPIIKQEIENVFGRRIVSSRDCIQLSDQIFTRTKAQLNPNTLRRFFGLVKADYPPSHSTLTILSKYCGFQSIDEINTITKTETVEVESNHSILGFLNSLFRDVYVKDPEDTTFLSLMVNTVNFLNRNPVLADKFQVQIAKTKNGQEFYFEKFVNIDKLNNYYGNGLRYYYAENTTTRANIFAHSLLTYRYWLTNSKDMVEQHYNVLSEETLNASVPSFVCARYYAAMIYHANTNSNCAEDIILSAYKHYSSLNKNNSISSFPHFELYLAEALVLTGYFDEGLYFIEQAEKAYKEKEDYGHWKFFQEFLLLKSIALYKTKKYVDAEAVFNKINPADFCFLRKSFSNILYLLLIKLLKRPSSKQEEQLDELIDATGFCHLKNIF